MLFNSLPFLFGFLPITVVVFFLLAHRSRLSSGLWLAAASLFFYGWWNASFVGLLMASVIFNYSAGYLISREIGRSVKSRAQLLLTVAISADLLLLGYYKYAGFFAEIANYFFRLPTDFGNIVLPLGISFFTFTQIAFLVDAYQGKVKEPNFIHYVLFATYFPHLIAGPILHHSQIMPQFAEARTYRIDWTNISVGLTAFAIGLAKKVLIADGLAKIATPVFAAASASGFPPMIEAWTGALAYTLQLYFDFSGYSDMAIGLSILFNVRLPLNFNSPYKATSIIDFWRCWHMTLSAFLRDYLYIPLGGNRKGTVRRYVNLFITMLLGGLWHGAAWTFVLWGALHGVYLMINHGFRSVRRSVGLRAGRFGRAGALVAGAITFVAVVVSWVLFRADSLAAGGRMLYGMSGGAGVLEGGVVFTLSSLDIRTSLASIAFGLAVVWLLPNTQEFMSAFPSAYEQVERPSWSAIRLVWQPTQWWAWSATGILLALSLLTLSSSNVSEFLYYQF